MRHIHFYFNNDKNNVHLRKSTMLAEMEGKRIMIYDTKCIMIYKAIL